MRALEAPTTTQAPAQAQAPIHPSAAAWTRSRRRMRPPPPEVTVVTVQPQSVPVVTELPGRTSAYLVAQVRARVDGIVLKREFTGRRRRQGGPAPVPDRSGAVPRRAGQRRGDADRRRRPTSRRPTAQAERYKILIAGNGVSKQEYDNAVAAQGQAAADVAAARRRSQTARINLGYTDVVSPISRPHRPVAGHPGRLRAGRAPPRS